MKLDADMLQKVGFATGALGFLMWTVGTMEKHLAPKPCAMAYDWWWA